MQIYSKAFIYKLTQMKNENTRKIKKGDKKPEVEGGGVFRNLLGGLKSWLRDEDGMSDFNDK